MRIGKGVSEVVILRQPDRHTLRRNAERTNKKKDLALLGEYILFAEYEVQIFKLCKDILLTNNTIPITKR